MIEELPADEKEMVVEYIHLLHGQSESDIAYRKSVLHAIQEGEEDFERGAFYESEEARKILLEKLKR